MTSGIKQGLRRFLGAVILLVIPAVLLAQDVKPRYPNHHWYSWWMNLLPDQASTYAPDVDKLFDWILWLTLIVFILVEGCLVYFLVKYRHKPGRKAVYYHGNNKLEITWTTIPALILVFLAVFSNKIWSEIRDPAQFPKSAPMIRIEPRQFEWDITYPGPDGEFDTPDDINTINQLYLAVHQPVQIMLQGQDVIHSFFVPEFRIKQDAVPGMPTSVWINPTREGEYEIACAELCGLGHYRMRGFVHIVSADSVARWEASEAPPPPEPAAAATTTTPAPDSSKKSSK